MILRCSSGLGAYMIETDKSTLYLRSFTNPIKRYQDMFDTIAELIDETGSFKTKDLSGHIASQLSPRDAVKDLRESYFQYMLETRSI